MENIRTKKHVAGEMSIKLSEVNEKLVDGVSAEKAIAELNDLAKEYKKLAEFEIFARIKRNCASNPHMAMIDAAMRDSFTTLAVKKTTDKEIDLTTYTIEEKSVILNLAHFEDFCKRDKNYGMIAVDSLWRYKIEQLMLDCLYVDAKNVGMTDDQIAEVKKCMYLSKTAASIAKGLTPTSNTQLLKRIQSIVDMMIPDIKINSHDVNFFKALRNKKGKERLTIENQNLSFAITLIAEILYHHLTGEKYRISGKMK